MNYTTCQQPNTSSLLLANNSLANQTVFTAPQLNINASAIAADADSLVNILTKDEPP